MTSMRGGAGKLIVYEVPCLLLSRSGDGEDAPFQLGIGIMQVGAGELIVYEVPLRTFTAHPNSAVGEGKQGTFLGFLEKVRRI